MKPLMTRTSATVKAVPQGTPRPGQLIGDRYKLDRPLERGAMGSVWRAEQVRLRAPVAVKFLDPSLIGDREMHDRFIQEARSAAAVRSAHVVQVFDYGSDDGVPYIAMELLDGENLDSRLGTRGTLTPAELAKLFVELARGISQAHAIGVIHRDLKPSNIFIAREGEHEVTKIVDFGIAKVKASSLRVTHGVGTQLGTLLGTPQYMSPEQVRGSSSIDHRTDLWALAVIACECLTGRCPFSGATIGDLTVQICTEKPPAPSSLGPVPAGFDQWFFKATQKKPNKRFQSVEELAERLNTVLGPALLAAPDGVRGGRLITFPSRSEVRIAYSAVVTWKGCVVNRLSETWVELRRLMLRVGQSLALEWQVARQRLRELLGSERLAFLRPLIERHGMLASVALLGCGILLLFGLTARSTDSRPVSAGPANVQQASAEPSATTTSMALEAVAAPQTRALTNEPNGGSPPEPTAPQLQAVPASPSAARSAPEVVAVAPSAVNDAAPHEQLNGAVQEPGTPTLDSFVVPKAAADKEGVKDAAKLAAAPRGRAGSGKSDPPNAAKPRATRAAKTAAEKATPVADTPMTQAMAQAAAKLMKADALKASMPAKKPATAAPAEAPRPARAQKPVTATPRSPSASPFDDRL
jgi:Protein kinase domain